MSQREDVGVKTPATVRRPRGLLVLLWVAAVPLFLGGLACVALAVQTIKELTGPASANGSPDWLLVLAASFFVLMVVALFVAGYLVLRPGRPHFAVWAITLVVGGGGAYVGAEQLAAAGWRAFTTAGVAAAIFLVVSVYLVAVSVVGIWRSLTRPQPNPGTPDDTAPTLS